MSIKYSYIIKILYFIQFVIFSSCYNNSKKGLKIEEKRFFFKSFSIKLDKNEKKNINNTCAKKLENINLYSKRSLIYFLKKLKKKITLKKAKVFIARRNFIVRSLLNWMFYVSEKKKINKVLKNITVSKKEYFKEIINHSLVRIKEKDHSIRYDVEEKNKIYNSKNAISDSEDEDYDLEFAPNFSKQDMQDMQNINNNNIEKDTLQSA